MVVIFMPSSMFRKILPALSAIPPKNLSGGAVRCVRTSIKNTYLFILKIPLFRDAAISCGPVVLLIQLPRRATQSFTEIKQLTVLHAGPERRRGWRNGMRKVG